MATMPADITRPGSHRRSFRVIEEPGTGGIGQGNGLAPNIDNNTKRPNINIDIKTKYQNPILDNVTFPG
jgi:hypothetical protein